MHRRPNATVFMKVSTKAGARSKGCAFGCAGCIGSGAAEVADAGRLQLQERVVADGATEFSVPRIVTYAVIDLKAVR